MMITTKYYEDFIQALDEQRFYDAHEVLEELWFPARFKSSNEVKLIKGFINAAVSFELLKKKRVKPSKKAWANYLKYRQLLFKIPRETISLYYKISLHIDELNKHYHRKSFI